MNIPVGHNGLVVPLNAMAPGSAPVVPASTEAQKGSQPDFAAFVAARPGSGRLVAPAEPDVPASNANADTPSDGAEAEGKISSKEQTTGPQATADENRDRHLETGTSLSARPLLPEALTKKGVSPAQALSADQFNSRGPATSAKHEDSAEEPIKAKADTPDLTDRESRIDSAPALQTRRHVPAPATSQMADLRGSLPAPDDMRSEAGAIHRNGLDSPIADEQTQITEFPQPVKSADSEKGFSHPIRRSTASAASDNFAKLAQANISDNTAGLKPLSGPAGLHPSTEALVSGSEVPKADNGRNGIKNEAVKWAPDAEKEIPIADPVAPRTTNVPPFPTAPVNPDSAAIQRTNGAELAPASISRIARESPTSAIASTSGVPQAPPGAEFGPNGEVHIIPPGSLLSSTPPKGQVASDSALQPEITSDAAPQKPDTARPAPPARSEVALPLETNTPLQPKPAGTVPLPIEGDTRGLDQQPLRSAMQSLASGPEVSLSARTEVAGTAARFSAFPALDSPAAPRVEIGGSTLGQAVQVPFRTASKNAELLHASPASAPVELSHSEAPKRSGPDMPPPTQTSASLAGPVPPTPMGIQPLPLASVFPAARAGEVDLKSETVSSLLMPSETPELSSWDASRITPTPPGATGPLRSELAAHVARQLVDVMGQAGNRPVEITLSPEELGRVRMGISAEDGRIIVNILAERPDTLDLMRRHIDQLGQTFRSMGYDQVAFSFGRGAEGGDQSGSAPPEGQASPSTGNAGLEGDLPSDAPTVINLDPTATRGVDIRL